MYCNSRPSPSHLRDDHHFPTKRITYTNPLGEELVQSHLRGEGPLHYYMFERLTTNPYQGEPPLSHLQGNLYHLTY